MADTLTFTPLPPRESQPTPPESTSTSTSVGVPPSLPPSSNPDPDGNLLGLAVIFFIMIFIALSKRTR